jgi:hypothetical protein
MCANQHMCAAWTLMQEAAKTAANGAEIAVGTRCINKGCTGEYAGESATGADQCWHHPGEPVFHEGYDVQIHPPPHSPSMALMPNVLGILG